MKPPANEPSFAERARQRRSSWPMRRFELGHEPGDSLLGTTTAAERVQMVEQMTQDAWAFAGGRPAPLPRRLWPGRVVRRGQPES